MLGYATVGSNDIERAKAFYDELFGAVGIPALFEHGSDGRVYGLPGQAMFAIVRAYNGEPATVGNGVMIGFALNSHEEVARFHAKALELGGISEGAPGPRGPPEAKSYMAFMRDLDGNKLCAMKIG